MADDTKIPAGAVDQNGVDLVGPLQTVLRSVNVLPEENDIGRVGVLAGTPDSVAIIEAGATTFSKAGVAAVGALGGGSVILAAVQGFWNGQQHGAMRIVLVSCFTGFLVAVLVALAVIIAADVRGRAEGSVAEYNARSAVTVELLRAVQGIHQGEPVPALHTEETRTNDLVAIAAAVTTAVLTALHQQTGNGSDRLRSRR